MSISNCPLIFMRMFTPDLRNIRKHRFFTLNPLFQVLNTDVTNCVWRPWLCHGSLLIMHCLDKSYEVLSLFLYNRSITCITKYVRNITTASCIISSENFEKKKIGVYRKMGEQICSHGLPFIIRDTVWHGSEQVWRLFSLVSFGWH